MKARRKWPIFQVLKEKNYPPRILCLTKISFRNAGEIKKLSDERQLRQFISILKEWLDSLSRKEFWNIKKEDQK